MTAGRATTALSRVVGNKSPAGSDVVPGSGLYSYHFAGPGRVTRVIWSTRPATVVVSVTAPVIVCVTSGGVSDVAPARGAVELAARPAPVFVTVADSVRA